MSWRIYLLFGLLGLGLASGVALFETVPGYMDADYYFAGGIQLSEGRGFSEPYLWNYLDDPQGLPHASHAYWMPLASILAAGGMALLGSGSWWGARIAFLAIAGLIPPVTAALAWALTSRRDLAVLSGLLALFSAFYLPFLPTTDTFGIYMLLGGAYFLLLGRLDSRWSYAGLGLLAGLMHLARTEGFLWLAVAMLAVVLRSRSATPRRASDGLIPAGMVLAGYLLIMAPWYARNLQVFGTLLAPGGSRMLWLTAYDQLFAYPAAELTFPAWWHSGLASILAARLWAAGMNLATLLGVQSSAILLPFIIIGIWSLRRDLRIRFAALTWSLLFLAMTLAFPFAGARGGFFHSGAALQTVWWALAPLGLERLIDWGARKRSWRPDQAASVFRPALLFMAAVLTAVLVMSRVLGWGAGPGWGEEAANYRRIDALLETAGMQSGQVVMVVNPPGFYLASRNPAVAVPDGDLETLLAVAERYQVAYLILERDAVPAGLLEVYQFPEGQRGLSYLGEIGAARVYLVRK